MKLTMIISSLSCGGAERVMSRIANYWAEKGWEITILTLSDGGKPPFFELHPKVIHHSLPFEPFSYSSIRNTINSLKQLLVLRRTIGESTPHVLISFMDKVNILVLWATIGMNFPVVISEHNSLEHHRIGRIWDALRQLTYPLATCLTVLTPDDLTYFSSALQRKGYVMPNPVVPPPPDYHHEEEFDRDTKTIIAVGSLTDQKSHDLLMRAFAAIASRCPGWSVTIWGEGELRTELEVLRDHLGLQGRVFLPGRTGRIYEEMKRSDLFVLSSRYEGFPNVLCEAMACGLPVISFDCSSGPRQIIRNATDGILVPPEDIGALSAAMEKLINEPEIRASLAFNAPEIVERFGLEKIMEMWETVIYDAMNHNHARNKVSSSCP